MDLEELADNPDFVTSVLQASQIAERNHKEEKINALRKEIRKTEPREEWQESRVIAAMVGALGKGWRVAGR